MKQDRLWYLQGIISSSLLTSNRSCDVTKHTIYTNILDFTEWILEKTDGKILFPTVLPISIVSRSMWNAAPPRPSILYLTPPSKRIMISHSVTEECENKQSCIILMQNIQRRNRQNPPDFNDIYCNFFIGGDGLIFEGRGWTVRGEHTKGKTVSHNDAVCVSFIGDFRKHPPKQSNIDALFKLLAHGVAINMLDPNYVINAQRDFHSSESPGDAFYIIIRGWTRFRSTYPS